MALAYLFEPTTQFQARTGANLTAGFLKVFYTQTDDAAPTYSDFAATPNEEEIVLDADGRAVVIVDDTKTYRLEVYNRNRGLLFTIDPITAMGGGGGGSMVYRVISTDGTVAIETTTSGGITYYDLSTAFTNEASNWGFRGAQIDSLDGSNDWQELPTVSTMGNVPYSFGWKATKDTAYDFAASVELPAGIAGAICGIDVRCDFQVDGVTVDTETGYIDPSRNVDRVSFEFKGQVSEDQKVDAKLYARCAEALTGTLVGRVFYNEECDGIVGGGGGNYTGGDFVEITSAKVINVTGVQPLSGMSSYVEKSAFDDCCSAMSGYVSSLSSQVSSLESSVSSISSTVSGLTGTYVEISSISGYSSIWNSASAVPNKLDESAFTAYTSTAQGFTGVTTDSTLTGNGMPGSALGVNGMELVFDSSMETSISGNSAIVGVGTAITSGFIPTSESGNFILTSQSGAFQPSGNYVSSSDMSGFVEVSSISGASSTWNSASAISSKLDESAFTAYTSTASVFSGVTTDSSLTGNGTPESALGINGMELVFDSSMSTSISGGSAIVGVDTAIMSGFISESAISAASSVWNSASAVSSLIPWSSLAGDGTSITSISGSAIGSTATGGKTYSGIAPVVVDNTADTIGVTITELVFNSPLSTSESAGSAMVDIDLGAYQTTAGMTAYQPSGDYIYASSLGTGVI